MELAERKRQILCAVIESYINSGEPVGSKALINEAGLNVSSATVRNEMADLTSRGYLLQPHTSAGRIPSQQGYRYYLDNIMRPARLSQSGRAYINSVLSQRSESPESILQAAAELLSELTNLAAVVTTPHGENSRVRRLSFVQTGSHTAMVVVIASNGIIKTKLFRCEFLITPELLNIFDKALNEAFSGIKLTSINQPFIQTTAARFGELSLLMPEVLTAIKDAAQRAGEASVCHSGYTKLLSAVDMSFSSARQIVEFLNNKHDLAHMLENLPQATSASVGRENSRTELSSSSVVSTRYFTNADHSGALAVIGPLRMDYRRVMSILESVAEATGKITGELTQIH